jgi:hypothetical protein
MATAPAWVAWEEWATWTTDRPRGSDAGSGPHNQPYGGMKMFGNLTNLEGSLFGDLRRMHHEMEEMYGPRV